MANDTEFGLAAYFYSRDIGRIWRVAEAAGVRHRRHQHRPDLHRRRPLRRGQGVGDWAARGPSTASRIILEIKYLCMGGIGR